VRTCTPNYQAILFYEWGFHSIHPIHTIPRVCSVFVIDTISMRMPEFVLFDFNPDPFPTRSNGTSGMSMDET